MHFFIFFIVVETTLGSQKLKNLEYNVFFQTLNDN